MAGRPVTQHRRRPLRRSRIRLARAGGAGGRLRGLLCRARPPGRRTGLWFLPCRAVHTWGMRYAIDVAFIDAWGRVLHIVRNVRPGRVVWCRRARSVIELAVNTVDSPLRYRRKLQAALHRSRAASPRIGAPSVRPP